MRERAFYSARVGDFLLHTDEQIIGAISQRHSLDLVSEQTGAWLEQCQILRPILADIAEPSDSVFFEFGIPRMGKRADAVLVISGIVLVLEFKIGATQFKSHDLQQTVDYALDLKHFHSGSHSALIVPVLVATEAESRTISFEDVRIGSDGLSEPLLTNRGNLQATLSRYIQLLGSIEGRDFRRISDAFEWAQSGYRPTPTIIQAAQALYQGHDVREISRSDAGADNLTATATTISNVIEQSKREGLKSVCFVTGVPGAGKTLAGLNIATERMNAHQDEHAVFLSGNGPLVTVLREALARDERDRLGVKKKDADRKAATFIQNIHHFRDDNLNTLDPPVEKVAVFDEAQRAWDREKTSKFMQIKKNQPGFNQSEPEFLLGVMDRHQDWCVIVALIGGGQEINTGEAGLSEWFKALAENFTDWIVHYSSHLKHTDYIDGHALTNELDGVSAHESDALHLAVSVRSFRAETLSDFVHALLENRPNLAASLYMKIRDRYPIYVTRDIGAAREWLRRQTRGSELSGMLASSGALRIRPEGLNVKAKIDPANWFLNGPEDVRSCQYLEEVATEFDVQGLELDWTCIAWDANLRRAETERSKSGWTFHRFSGTKWQNLKDLRKQAYLKNSYRVLLTRARQGMVIFIPRGDLSDTTRSPSFYDSTYSYLVSCGIPELVND